MKVRADTAIILTVVICAIVFAGEYVTYYSATFSYDVDASVDAGEVRFDISSSGSDVYDAVIVDAGDFVRVEDLRIYVDETYDEYCNQAKKQSDFPYLDQEYYAEQVIAFLKVRSYTGASSCDASGLLSFIESTMHDASGKGIMVTSYALPSFVYDGTPDCPLMEWVLSGGSLYWVGSEIGKFYVNDEGLHSVDRNQQLFLGAECVYTGGSLIATEVLDNGFTDALTLRNSNVMNGVRTSDVPGAVGMGYSEEGYSSISMIPSGSGMICVIAGPFDIDQLDDISQIVVAGISHESSILNHSDGKVVRGTISESFEIPEDVNIILYAYIGGTYPKYGEAYIV